MQYMLPLFAAVTCGGLLLSTHGKQRTKAESDLRNLFAACLAAGASSWILFFTVRHLSDIHVSINFLFYCILLLVQVLSYHLLFMLARTDKAARFPRFHYIPPLLFGAAFMIWMLSTPQITTTDGYIRFLSVMPWIVLTFGITYAVLTFVLIHRYYSVITVERNPFPDPRKRAADLSTLGLSSLVGTAALLFLNPGNNGISWMVLLTAAFIVWQYLFVTYNIIRRRLRFSAGGQKNDERSTALSVIKNGNRTEKSKNSDIPLMKRRFEAYMKNEKPYLDPHFKMSVVVEKLGVNRTYVSRFINETYGMNFSRYVNGLRLSELRRLSKSPSNTGAKPRELAVRAGFANTKHYLRAVRVEQSPANASLPQRTTKNDSRQ